MKKLLYKLKSGTEENNFGRTQIVDLASLKLKGKKITLLDLGAGHGTDLNNIKASTKVPLEMFAVENYKPYVKELQDYGIKVLEQDLEHEKLDLPGSSVDIIIANQVIEHVKEIFWIFSEVSRLLKPGGIFIVGVPNLASLHNRFALMAGQQPTSVAVLGAHVRGFTYPSFKKFIECDDYFKVLERKGANFYPFPHPASKHLAKLLPSMAVGMFISIERTDKKGNFIEVLKERFYETPYRTSSLQK